jgi:hypothetical protein
MATDLGLDNIIQSLLQGGTAWNEGRAQGQELQGNDQALALGRARLGAIAQQQRDEQQYNHDVGDWMSRGSPPSELPALAIKYPQQYQAIKAGWDLKDKAQQTADLSFFGQGYAAAKSGRADLLKKQLTERRDAEKANGIDTSEIEDLLQQFGTDPKGAMDTFKSVALAHIYAGDPDKFGDAFGVGKDNSHTVGRAIGHYEGGAFKVDYRDPEAGKYERVVVTNEDGSQETRFVLVGGDGQPSTGGGGGASGKSPSPDVVKDGQLDARAFYKDFVLPHEGGYAAHDANGAPVNHGINQSANPGVDVANLTEDQAADIFASKYATPAKLPPAMAAAYNDTAFINPTRAAQFLAASGGNVDKFLAMRRAWQNSLVKKDPDKYGKYAKAWVNRNADLADYVGQLGGGASPQAGGSALSIKTKPAGSSAILDDDTVSAMAEQYLAGDKSVLQNLGRGNQGAGNIVKLRTEIRRQAQAQGMTGRDVATQMADFTGILAGERASGTRIANVELASSEAQKVLPLARAASNALPRSGFLPFSKAEQKIRGGFNDPRLRKFVAANTALVNVYSRAVSPTGVGTVNDKEHARELLDTAYDQPSYNAVLDQMEKEIAAARAAPQDVRHGLRAAVGGERGGSHAAAPSGFRILSVRPK